MQPQPSFQRHLTTCKVAKLRPGERHRTLDISDPKSLSFQSTSSSTRNAKRLQSYSLKMSSSDNLTVSFGILKDQENFRLLELPPALLALITSANPPRYLFPPKL